MTCASEDAGAERLAIYGSRPDGHAKVLLDLFPDRAVGFIDDVPENRDRIVRGLPVLGSMGDHEGLIRAGVTAIAIGFGDHRSRRGAVERVLAGGFRCPSLIHASATVSSSARCGPGCQMLALAYVGADAVIGSGVLVNTRATVEHDARIEAGAVIAPGAVLLGRSQVGERAAVWASAVVAPDVRIGAGAQVGAGSVVLDDVDDGVFVAGVPARPVRRAPA